MQLAPSSSVLDRLRDVKLHAINSVRDSFQDDETEAALLVDESNAFNSLNRISALHNIRHLCPSISNKFLSITFRALY